MAITKVNNAMQDALAAAQPTITSVGTLTGLDVNGTVTANAGVVVDTITIDGSEIDASGSLTLDVAGNITLDADDAGEIRLKDGGTQYGALKIDSNRLKIQSIISDADMLFAGNDGGSEITALTLDMSEAGAAIFNDAVTSGGDITTSTNLKAAQIRVMEGNSTAGGLFKEKNLTGSGSSNDITIFAESINDGGDIHFMTGGSVTKRLTIDSSGTATFSDDVIADAFLPTTEGAYGSNHVGVHSSGVVLNAATSQTGYIMSAGSAVMTFAPTGGTIQLGGFTAANKLDSYEEGVFTATLRGSTGQPNPLITTTAKYTKVGDTVNVWVSFESVNTTGYSGTVTITGLPFTNNGGRVPFAVVPYVSTTWNSGYQVTGFIQNQSTTLSIFQFGSGSPYAGALHAAGANKYWWCQATYKT